MKRAYFRGIQASLYISLALLCCLFITACNSATGGNENSGSIQERGEDEQQSVIRVNANRMIADYAETQNASTLPEGAEVLISSEEFSDMHTSKSAVGLVEATVRYSPKETISVGRDDVLCLSFEAYAEGASNLKIACSDVVTTIQLNSTPRAFYIPITGIEQINELSFKCVGDYVATNLFAVQLMNYHTNIPDDVSLRLGANTLTSFEETVIPAENRLKESSAQMLADADHLYVLSSGSLEVCDKDFNHIGVCEGLGSTRDMEFLKDGSAIIVTSRRSGVYIVDISTPENPQVLSHYDALEYPTGIAVNGDYAFICSRMFGVEIVDVSDYKNPRFICSLQGDDEYQDCFFADGYLYVGVYNGKRVDIWDIRTIDNPSCIASIDLDGSGQGVFVADGLLYAATGLKSRNESSQLYDYGYGTGNGLEIYDVTDPSNPVWLSTTKTNGRMYCNRVDIWDVSVQDNLAFLSGSFSGLYIYDVCDPINPVLLKETEIVASKESELYTAYDLQKYVFPYDAQNETHGAVSHVVFDNNMYYVTTSNMGVYKEFMDGIRKTEEKAAYSFTLSGKNNEIPEFKQYNAKLYKNDYQMWAVDRYRNDYIVANGSGGILVFNQDLDLLASVDTKDAVRDIKVFGDYIFTAECSAGVGIYKVDEGTITNVRHFSDDADYTCVGSIALTHDGAFLIAESGQRHYFVLNVKDPSAPFMVDLAEMNVPSDPGLIYYRTICNGLVDEKYVVISGGTTTIWFSSDNGELKADLVEDTWYYSSENGATAVGNRILQVAKSRLFYRDALSDQLSSETIRGLKLRGKCAHYNGNLVVTSGQTGQIAIIDISDINNPSLIEYNSIHGNVDVAYIDDDGILIPCRYQGLLKLTDKQ